MVKQLRKKEYQQLFISFSLMVVLTVLAFLAISSENITGTFAVPFIVFLAVMQVVLQLFIFMHLKEKGHAYALIFISAGVVFAGVTVAILVHTRVL